MTAAYDVLEDALQVRRFERLLAAVDPRVEPAVRRYLERHARARRMDQEGWQAETDEEREAIAQRSDDEFEAAERDLSTELGSLFGPEEGARAAKLLGDTVWDVLLDVQSFVFDVRENAAQWQLTRELHDLRELRARAGPLLPPQKP